MATLTAAACLVAAWGCQPAVSSTPLGYGPLSVAELTEAPDPEPAHASPRRQHSGGATVESQSAAATAEQQASAANRSEPQPSASEAAPAGTPTGIEKYAGLFAGEDIAVFQLGSFPAREQVDPNARIRVEVSGEDTLHFVLINSENDEDLCTLKATLTRPGQAKLEADQPCFAPPDQDALQGTIQTGTAEFEDDLLTLQASGELRMSVGDNELEGELSYDFTGSRR